MAKYFTLLRQRASNPILLLLEVLIGKFVIKIKVDAMYFRGNAIASSAILRPRVAMQ